MTASENSSSNSNGNSTDIETILKTIEEKIFATYNLDEDRSVDTLIEEILLLKENISSDDIMLKVQQEQLRERLHNETYDVLSRAYAFAVQKIPRAYRTVFREELVKHADSEDEKTNDSLLNSKLYDLYFSLSTSQNFGDQSFARDKLLNRMVDKAKKESNLIELEGIAISYGDTDLLYVITQQNNLDEQDNIIKQLPNKSFIELLHQYTCYFCPKDNDGYSHNYFSNNVRAVLKEQLLKSATPTQITQEVYRAAKQYEPEFAKEIEHTFAELFKKN